MRHFPTGGKRARFAFVTISATIGMSAAFWLAFSLSEAADSSPNRLVGGVASMGIIMAACLSIQLRSRARHPEVAVASTRETNKPALVLPMRPMRTPAPLVWPSRSVDARPTPTTPNHRWYSS